MVIALLLLAQLRTEGAYGVASMLLSPQTSLSEIYLGGALGSGSG